MESKENKQESRTELIEKYLSKNGMNVDSIEEDGDFVTIGIDWGDWKHDHLRLRHMMENFGYVFAGTEETETDGSDCYSAIHTFFAA